MDDSDPPTLMTQELVPDPDSREVGLFDSHHATCSSSAGAILPCIARPVDAAGKRLDAQFGGSLDETTEFDELRNTLGAANVITAGERFALSPDDLISATERAIGALVDSISARDAAAAAGGQA